jgi:thymidine phosphorylase
MKTVEDARELARSMVSIGEAMGKRVIAYLTRMEEPLGRMVGNACEVIESVETLHGRGPADIRELVVTLGGAMVEIGHGVSVQEGRARIETALDDGSALAHWNAMISKLGGDMGAILAPTGQTTLRARRSGYVTAINGLEVGWIGVELGAGRKAREDEIDPRIGIRLDALRGSEVEEGDALATVFHGEFGPPTQALLSRLEQAFSFGEQPPDSVSLVIERVG